MISLTDCLIYYSVDVVTVSAHVIMLSCTEESGINVLIELLERKHVARSHPFYDYCL